MNLLTLSFGFACGWASPNNFLLKSDDSPLPSGKITTEESSWITSLMCVGALIGNYVFTFATSKFGRKKPLISLAIPSIVSILPWSIRWHSNISNKHFFLFTSISGRMGIDFIRSKCVLFVCWTIANWHCRRGNVRISCYIMITITNECVFSQNRYVIVPQYFAEVSSDR